MTVGPGARQYLAVLRELEDWVGQRLRRFGSRLPQYWYTVGGVVAGCWFGAYVVGMVNPGLSQLAILVALLASVIWVRVSRRPRPIRNASHADEEEAFNAHAMNFVLGDEVARKANEPERLYVYIRLLTIPGHLSRVSEFSDLSTDLVEREVTSTWTLPESAIAIGSHGIWFPVLTPVKGALVDRLQVFGDSGATIPVLAVREAHAIEVAAWFLIVDRLKVQGDLSDDAVEELRMLGAKVILMRLPRGAAQDPSELQTIRTNTRDSLNAALRRHGLPVGSTIELIANRYLATLAVRFVVTAFVSAPTEHVVISHRYRMDSSALLVKGRRDSPRLRRLTNFVKSFIGRTSHVYRLDLATVHQARSFHLELLIPRGNYFAMAALTDVAGEPVERPATTDYSVEPWYYRISHLGHRYLHFYSRQLGGKKDASELTFRVLEVPWASLLLALAFATMSTACLSIVAFMTDASRDAALGIAQVVVALPITVALAWLSLRPPTRRIARQALGFGLSLATLVVLTLATIMVFGEAADWSIPIDFASEIGISGPSELAVGLEHAEALFWIELLLVGIAVTSLCVRVIAFLIDYRAGTTARDSRNQEVRPDATS